MPIYEGDTNTAKNVILVTINYRLGLLGRFAHQALSSEQAGQLRANYGLMDQISALQWVNANIGAFGKDAANVKIFGYSAGGVAVNYLMTAPSARGLFTKAIAQSGGPEINTSAKIGQPAWLFYFDYKAPRGTVPGVSHGDEVPYIFGTLPGKRLVTPANALTDEGRAVSTLMTGYWTNFAKTGNPNGKGLPALASREADINAMNPLNANPQVDPHCMKQPMLFLDAYYDGLWPDRNSASSCKFHFAIIPY